MAKEGEVIMPFTLEKLTSMIGDWAPHLIEDFNYPYMTSIMRHITRDRKEGYEVAPASEDVFKALKLCQLADVKVVILGQDPYPTRGMASGLAFGIHEDFLGVGDSTDYTGLRLSRSFENIITAVENDIGFHGFIDATLEHWAQQGVLLLNTALTVRVGQPGSHTDIGWNTFIEKIMEILYDEKNDVVWLLWGKHAQGYKGLIDPFTHKIFETSHPSPYSAHLGFLECKHFSKTNKFLEETGQEPIDWYKHPKRESTVVEVEQEEDEALLPWEGDPRFPKGTQEFSEEPHEKVYVVTCPYCKSRAKLVTGEVIYPHRQDLYHKKFYYCKKDAAYVGVHEGTTKPLGRLADKKLRVAKVAAHNAFDPLWKNADDPKKARKEKYSWLARKLNIPATECHIGMFDVATCNKVVEICTK